MKQVRVEKYKSRRKMQAGIEELLPQGWSIEQTTSHRPMWSAWGTEQFVVTFTRSTR